MLHRSGTAQFFGIVALRAQLFAQRIGQKSGTRGLPFARIAMYHRTMGTTTRYFRSSINVGLYYELYYNVSNAPVVVQHSLQPFKTLTMRKVGQNTVYQKDPGTQILGKGQAVTKESIDVPSHRNAGLQQMQISRQAFPSYGNEVLPVNSSSFAMTRVSGNVMDSKAHAAPIPQTFRMNVTKAATENGRNSMQNSRLLFAPSGKSGNVPHAPEQPVTGFTVAQKHQAIVSEKRLEPIGISRREPMRAMSVYLPMTTCIALIPEEQVKQPAWNAKNVIGQFGERAFNQQHPPVTTFVQAPSMTSVSVAPNRGTGLPDVNLVHRRGMQAAVDVDHEIIMAGQTTESVSKQENSAGKPDGARSAIVQKKLNTVDVAELAENVYRLIEDKIKIERQRRGILR
jgi:hypothetical protein